MSKIFISYRRQDTLQIAGRIYDRLDAKFGRDAVFMDIDNIPFGVDFHDYLGEAVGRAEIVLALIGHGWAEARDESGRRRLDNPDDFVRIEIETALKRKLWLGAVVIDGAPMPRPEQLPEGMRALTRRNAAFVDAGRDFHIHMDRLIADLEPHVNGWVRQAEPKREAENTRRRVDGRIEIDAALVSNPHGRWFLPGAGKTESFRDLAEGPEMAVVPAGEFMMGSPNNEAGRWSNEGPQHKAIIPRPFAVGKYAVTFDEWDAAAADGACGGYKPKEGGVFRGWGRGRRPVINVSWNDARAYIEWLKAKTGKDYRLPTEAEWEYVCRAGSKTRYWWGDTISRDQANYSRLGGPTVPVDSFKPNAWGLYQVHGNVWEWCEDVWHGNYDGAPTDGSAWTTGDGSLRVLRGGACVSDPQYLRAAFRFRNSSGIRYDGVGFRVSRTLIL